MSKVNPTKRTTSSNYELEVIQFVTRHNVHIPNRERQSLYLGHLDQHFDLCLKNSISFRLLNPSPRKARYCKYTHVSCNKGLLYQHFCPKEAQSTIFIFIFKNHQLYLVRRGTLLYPIVDGKVGAQLRALARIRIQWSMVSHSALPGPVEVVCHQVNLKIGKKR